jgi:inosine-uridine nucleoside N-ribohydrolase
LHSDVAASIKRIILVGGAMHEPGNAGPVSEFHFACDPKAAARVLHAPTVVTLIPLDMMRKVLFSPTDLLGDLTALSPAYHFLRQVVPFGIAATSHLYGIEGFHLKDVLGVVAAALPMVIHTKHMRVDVELHGELTRGMSVFDRRAWESVKPNVNVVVDVDYKDVRQYIKRVIGY